MLRAEAPELIGEGSERARCQNRLLLASELRLAHSPYTFLEFRSADRPCVNARLSVKLRTRRGAGAQSDKDFA